MLKIVKVWYNTDYLRDRILQFYPNIYTPPPQLKVTFLKFGMKRAFSSNFLKGCWLKFTSF